MSTTDPTRGVAIARRSVGRERVDHEQTLGLMVRRAERYVHV
jgi:hypothetical protein